MSRPSRILRSLVRLACCHEDRPFVLADLETGFHEVARERGAAAAHRWYASQVARSFGPCLGRRLSSAVSGFATLRGAGADVRYALRRLVRTPAQVAITVASLGVGIGLFTAAFAVGNAFLLEEPRGVTDPEGLVSIWTSDERGEPYQFSSYPDYLEIADGVEVLGGVAALRSGVLPWERDGATQRVIAEIVTGDYFDVLGVRMPLGRGFRPDETVVGAAEPVAVVSHAFWQDHFGGDRGILGETLRLSGRDFTVVGVAPPGLLGRFLRMKVAVWVPLGLPGGIYHTTPRQLADRAGREFLVVGRLAEGADREGLQARLDVLAARLHDEYPDAWSDDRGRARAFTAGTLGDASIPPPGRRALLGAVAFFLAGCGLVLLIACVNVAGLFLARSAQRWREVAVRLSLGASRGRLLRLLMVEALILALCGGLVGVWLAAAATSWMGNLPLPVDVPLSIGVSLDAAVLGFALAASLGVCVVFGLVPALQSTRPDLVPALKGEGPGGGAVRGLGGLRGGLVVAQVAASVLLLVGSGLAVRSALLNARMEHGIDPEGLALASITFREGGVSDDQIRMEALSLLERVASRPDIAGAELASAAELSAWLGSASARIEVPGYDPGEGESLVMPFNAVTPGYFALVGLRATAGRVLDEGDREGAPPVALVNRTFAERYFGGASALGRRFTLVEKRTFSTPQESVPRTFEIVGVVPDVRATATGEGRPFFWTSFHQNPTRQAVVHARGRPGLSEALTVLREEVRPEGDDLQLVPPQSYREAIAFTLLPQRIASRALGWAGGFALLLALIGIYGVVSHAVSRRAREMAIRQAIGAGSGRIFRETVSGGLRLALVGAALGLAAAIPIAFFIRGQLAGVSPFDPVAVLGSVAVLLAGAGAATAVPAVRVLSVDPMAVLREE